MNFIVLDLEWNQCPTGKPDAICQLPFEIIEIGAFKLDEMLTIKDSFREIIRPQVYRTLHFKTREIISLRSIDLENGRTFPEVIRDFFDWCGSDPCFCTWGPSDLMELQRNMAYHDIPNTFPFPLMYYDIQKIFSIRYEDRRTRRSLEFAVDYLSISKEVAFHCALSDAHYTSLVMQHMTRYEILENSSVDYFRTPENRKEEIHIQYPTYTKYVSRPFPSKIQAMKDRVVTSTSCFLCRKNIPKKIRWFSSGSRNYLCLCQCEEHGYLKGKIRLRQRGDGKYYAVKTIRFVTPDEASAVAQRKESQHNKNRT